MKFLKMAIIICSFLLFVSGCAGETTPQESQDIEIQTTNEEMNGAFRYSNWGDTIEQVEKAEGREYFANGTDLILYRDIKLLTYNANTIYFFDENQLDSACYEITESYTNDELYVKDFENIDKEFKNKYGIPEIQMKKDYSDVLKEERYKDTPFAVYTGDIKYVTIWKTEKAHIIHSLSSDNHEIEHVIFYINPNAENRTDTTGL